MSCRASSPTCGVSGYVRQLVDCGHLYPAWSGRLQHGAFGNRGRKSEDDWLSGIVLPVRAVAGSLLAGVLYGLLSRR